MKNSFPDPDVYFYYLRQPNRQIFGGVCLKKADGVWNRGVSICSIKDQFDKNICKRLAYKRLMKAIGAKQAGLPVKRLNCSCNKMFEYGSNHSGTGELLYKSRYNASLTKVEQEITKSKSDS